MTGPFAYSPLYSLLHTLALWGGGRLHFPRERVGQMIQLDCEDWQIFRQVVVDARPGQPEIPAVVFRPRFHVAGMSPAHNMRFSLLPIPFFIGLPGFRSKLWLINPRSCDFSGWYEWDQHADAEAYSRSFAMRFMARRSLPGSVSWQIIANPRLQMT